MNPRLFKLRQNGEISPNLVTLPVSVFFTCLRNFEEPKEIRDLNGCDAGSCPDDTGNDLVPHFR